MYKEEKAVLFTRVGYPDVCESNFTHLPTNGTYIRGFSGQLLGRYRFEDRGIFYMGECEGGSFQGNITDPILCERITEYFANLHGKRYTNCAAMAHYLTTGEFIECVEGDGMAVVHQGMRPFDMAARIDVGDMVGIVYGNPRTIGSRKFPGFRMKFRKAKKRRLQKGTFTSSVPMVRKSFTADEVRTMCKCASATDYHFMVCVDHYRGKPIWISQYGHMPPGSPNVAVVLTIGEYDPYQQHTPLFSLIKKRR